MIGASELASQSNTLLDRHDTEIEGVGLFWKKIGIKLVLFMRKKRGGYLSVIDMRPTFLLVLLSQPTQTTTNHKGGGAKICQIFKTRLERVVPLYLIDSY